MSKSNDKIPRDEMLLAEAIAAAKARGLKFTAYQPFRNGDDLACEPRDAVSVCALGALYFAGRLSARETHHDHVPKRLSDVSTGNDRTYAWSFEPENGESLGWAFRCFFEED